MPYKGIYGENMVIRISSTSHNSSIVTTRANNGKTLMQYVEFLDKLFPKFQFEFEQFDKVL